MDYLEIIERAADQALTHADPLLKKRRNGPSQSTAAVKHCAIKTAPLQVTAGSDFEIKQFRPVSEFKIEQIRTESEFNAKAQQTISDFRNNLKAETKQLAIRPTYYSVQIKQQLWEKSGGVCEYVDAMTNRRCSSKFGLDRDHIIPIAKGGTHEISNLRLLCHSHHQLVTIHEFGIEKMNTYLR